MTNVRILAPSDNGFMANKNNPDAIPALIWVVSCKIKKLENYIRSGRKNNGVNLLTEYNFNETPNNAKNINRTVTSEETAESDLQITRKKGS